MKPVTSQAFLYCTVAGSGCYARGMVHKCGFDVQERKPHSTVQEGAGNRGIVDCSVGPSQCIGQNELVYIIEQVQQI